MRLADFPLLDPGVIAISVQGNEPSHHTWQPNTEASLWSDGVHIWLKQANELVEVFVSGWKEARINGAEEWQRMLD